MKTIPRPYSYFNLEKQRDTTGDKQPMLDTKFLMRVSCLLFFLSAIFI